MAIQNFLSGGYYGKLGDTVGQRWKNKRTIRAYVIPSNPRTEKQQKNRGNFGLCTAKSQIALQMNYKTTLFNSTSSSAWNERMSTARNLQKDGEQNLDLIPLYPYSYVPTYIISEIFDFKKENETYYTASVKGTLPSVDRSMSILIQTQNAVTSEVLEEFLFKADFITGVNPYIKIYNANINLSGYKLKARIVSNDDTAPADIVVSREVEILGKTLETVYLDFSEPTVTRAGNVVTVTSKTPFETIAKTVVGAKITVVKAGQYVTEDPLSVDVIDSNGNFAIQIETDSDTDINTAFFGTDCDLSFTTFALETDTKVFMINGNRLQITESSPTYKISGYTVDIPDDDTIQGQFHCNEGAAALGTFTQIINCQAYIGTLYSFVICNLSMTSENGKTTFKILPMPKVYPANKENCTFMFNGKIITVFGVNYEFQSLTATYSNKKTFVDLSDKNIFVNGGNSKLYAYYTKDASTNIKTYVSAKALAEVTGVLANQSQKFSLNKCSNIKVDFDVDGNHYSAENLVNADCNIKGSETSQIGTECLTLGFNFGSSVEGTGASILYGFTLSKVDSAQDSFIGGDELAYPIKINPEFTFAG